jgi:ABC-type multidrug transport system fused ATPase/permease subunit
MRITDPQIKLVIVDGPSAAMDLPGEFELFKHLREASEDRTMMFITHRFGHMVKHADLILVMKEGELVESGTHEELIGKNGEYLELYNIQVQAFA